MLGTVEKGKIIDENENAYYVQIDGITYELKKQEITQDDIPKVGDEIEGFIYDNKHHDREMTQFLPFAQPDQYGWGKVTEVRPGLGVFVDVGLPDKDVVLSMDDLPREKERWPRVMIVYWLDWKQTTRIEFGQSLLMKTFLIN